MDLWCRIRRSKLCKKNVKSKLLALFTTYTYIHLFFLNNKLVYDMEPILSLQSIVAIFYNKTNGDGFLE